MDHDRFASPVENQAATSLQLIIALVFLLLTIISIAFLFSKLTKSKKGNYSYFDPPFNHIVSIYVGLFLIIVNEIIILASVILTDQTVVYFGREKSIFIVAGLGLFIYGWTKLLLFNVSLGNKTSKIIGFAFLGAMIFYIFSLTMTILFTFGIVNTSQFLGIGYSSAVAIYGSFLILDLIAVIYIANQKRKQSKYQAWVGILLFTALFLNFLSIIINVIPLVTVDLVDPQIHAMLNYVVEPASYFITTTFSLLFLYWTLFNPEWLNRRTIEVDS